MNSLIKENLTNLQQLWQLYGAKEIVHNEGTRFFGTEHWPYRHWFQSTETPIVSIPDKYIGLLNSRFDNAILSTWHTLKASEHFIGTTKKLLDAGWQHSFSQTGMYLPIDNKRTTVASTITLKEVSNHTDINIWCNIGSQAFNYSIESHVIKSLLDKKNITLYLMTISGKAIGAAMLLHSENCSGVHQVGVLPNHQGKGYAKAIMLALIEECRILGVQHLVLQASKVGLPLYKKLGFIEQFTVNNFVNEPTFI